MVYWFYWCELVVLTLTTSLKTVEFPCKSKTMKTALCANKRLSIRPTIVKDLLHSSWLGELLSQFVWLKSQVECTSLFKISNLDFIPLTCLFWFWVVLWQQSLKRALWLLLLLLINKGWVKLLLKRGDMS